MYLAAASAAGFFWAATFAHLGLLDALPSDWEGRDIQLVGVVASLPQLHERGERFVFGVEQVETPGATVPKRIFLPRYFIASYRNCFRHPHPDEVERYRA